MYGDESEVTIHTNRPRVPMTDHDPTPRAAPRPQPRIVLCPYCGSRSRDLHRCESCSGYFDPLSRQATQNAMGPWFIRDDAQPFRPGCSFGTLCALVRRGKVTPETPIRGPTTRQFWVLAKRCPGVANLFGICHACARAVEPHDSACRHCGVSFEPPHDRQQLGLGSVRLLPGQAAPEDVAATSEPGLAPLAHAPAASDEPVVSDAIGADRPLTPALDERVLARVQSLERHLRVLRRSRAIYLAVVVVLLLSSVFVFAAPSLGIALGPVDRWLGRAVPDRRELAQPDISHQELVPVRPIPVQPSPFTPGNGERATPEPGVSSTPPSVPAARADRSTEATSAEIVSRPQALGRHEDLTRSGRPEELESADDVANRVIADGLPDPGAARLLDASDLRRAWLELRTYP